MTRLFSKNFVAAAAVALATLGAATTMSANDAQAGYWHRHHGLGLAAGVIGAVAVGAAIASSRPAYAHPGHYYARPVYYRARPVHYRAGAVRRCHFVQRVNHWGDVIGSRRVCRTYY